MRKVGKTLVPEDVENLIFRIHGNSRSYATHIRKVATWSTALNMVPKLEHVYWDDEMWRLGTECGRQWDEVREKAKPKEAEQLTFDKPTLLQCPMCQQNMVNIDKMIQKRGCDEPATVYASCKNPACKQKLGREHRFRTEG